LKSYTVETYFIYLKTLRIEALPILKLKKFSPLYLICLVYLFSTTLFIPNDISAYEVTFAWDANDEPDLECSSLRNSSNGGSGGGGG